MPDRDGSKLNSFLGANNALQKYIDFFLKMEYLPKGEKVKYLYDNKDILNALTYQHKR